MTTRELQAAPATLHELIGQVAAEIASPLTRALERVAALLDQDDADREQLLALQDEIAQARRVGILGQQVARLASGAVRQVIEPIDLRGMLAELLAEHRRHAGAAAAAFQARLDVPVTVVGDTGLAGAVLRSLLDWCNERAGAGGRVALTLHSRPAAHQAVLACRFQRLHRAEGQPEPLSWQLMTLAAAPLGTRISVADDASGATTVLMRFDRLVAPEAAHQAGNPDLRLLAGWQLLVVSPDRDMRQQVRQAVQGLDLLVDFVTSVDAASDYCDDGLPQAIVYASGLAGATLERLQRRLALQSGGPAFIEVSPDTPTTDTLPPTGTRAAVPRIGLEALASSLPAALASERTRRG